MALIDDVKAELLSINDEPAAVKKAQVASILRFTGTLGIHQRQYFFKVQLGNKDVAQWLQTHIQELFGHEAKIRQVEKPSGSDIIQYAYLVLVFDKAPHLALQCGLIDRHVNRVRGLPVQIVSGNTAQVRAAWRGAFLACGRLSDPGRASCLEILCPNTEVALALVGAARRLGVVAKARQVDGVERVQVRDSDAIERLLIVMGAVRTAREWSGKRNSEIMNGKANRLANFDDANMRRSAKAAVEASEKVRQAFEILGDNIPENLRKAGQMRLEHRDASLEELGRLSDPPITKDAIAGRLRRLLQMSKKAQEAKAQGKSLR